MHKKICILVLIFMLLLPILQINAIELKENYNLLLNNNTNLLYGNEIDELNFDSDIDKNNIITSYQIVIEDDANLLTENEEKELRNQMARLSEFGNVIFKTTNIVTNKKPLKYIQDYYYSKFKNVNGVAFYIDMKSRELCACATGVLDNKITSSKCNTIMDNVYRYATRGEYYICAVKTFEQMENVLNGLKIAESMKYICNAILSIMISLFLTFGFFKLVSKNNKASQNELIKECISSLNYTPIQVNKTGTHKEYSPQSSSSSGGRRRLF